MIGKRETDRRASERRYRRLRRAGLCIACGLARERGCRTQRCRVCNTKRNRLKRERHAHVRLTA